MLSQIKSRTQYLAEQSVRSREKLRQILGIPMEVCSLNRRGLTREVDHIAPRHRKGNRASMAQHHVFLPVEDGKRLGADLRSQ